MNNGKNYAIIVDGYNLLHQVVDPRQLKGPGAWARARQAFLDRLATRIREGERQDTLVVFDSAKPEKPDKPVMLKTSGLAVVYATAYSSADEMIIELIRRLPSPPKTLIISSDRQIMAAAKRKKCKVQTSIEWLERADPASPETKSIPRDVERTETIVRHEPIEEVERAYWLREFGSCFDPDEGAADQE